MMQYILKRSVITNKTIFYHIIVVFKEQILFVGFNCWSLQLSPFICNKVLISSFQSVRWTDSNKMKQFHLLKRMQRDINKMLRCHLPRYTVGILHLWQGNKPPFFDKIYFPRLLNFFTTAFTQLLHEHLSKQEI